MALTVVPHRICGTIDLPPTDAEVCRFLAAAAFSSSPTVLRCPGTGADSLRMITLLSVLGAEIRWGDGFLTVHPVPRPLPPVKELDFGTSAICLRILLPVVCRFHSGVRFVGQGTLAGQNPVEQLTALLSDHGCAFDSPALPFYADGIPDAGTYVFSDLPDENSLFGLALMLSLCPDRGQIRCESRFSPLLMSVLRIFSLFDAVAEENLYGWFFPAGCLCPIHETLFPRGDSVLSCLWLAAGACSGPVTVRGVDPEDPTVLTLISFLEAAGATVVVNGSSISAFSEGPLQWKEFFDVPAVLLPAMTVLCSGRQPVRLYASSVNDPDFAASVIALHQAFSQVGVSLTCQSGICDLSGRVSGDPVVVDSPFPEVLAALLLVSSCLRVPLTVADTGPLLSHWPSFLNSFRLLNGEYTVSGPSC